MKQTVTGTLVSKCLLCPFVEFHWKGNGSWACLNPPTDGMKLPYPKIIDPRCELEDAPEPGGEPK